MTALSKLSPRHRQCLDLLASGRRGTKAIAAELNLSPGTVDNYLAEAKTILGASDRHDAVERYLALTGTPRNSHMRTATVDAPTVEIAPQPRQETTKSSRDLSWYTKRWRLALILAGSLAITTGIGIAVVIVVGLISIAERSGS